MNNCSGWQALVDDLRSVGLADYEAHVFLCLVKHKCLTASEVSRKTHHSIIVTKIALTLLVERGLVRAESDEKYRLEERKHVYGWFSDQQSRTSTLYSHAWIQLHSFWEASSNHSWKPEIDYYEGVEGIKAIYEDILETLAAKRGKKVVYCWTDFESKTELIGQDFVDDYAERRKAAGIVIHAIKPKTTQAIRDQSTGQRQSIVHLVNGFSLHGEVRIYGDKVAVITFDKNHPVGVVIEGQVTRAVVQGIFEAFWDKSA